MSKMKIGGFHKISLIDYPGLISAVIFVQGCNFKCSYCHNPELIYHDLYEECLSEGEIFSFLEHRKGKIDAVTISGGEPTIQPDLTLFTKRIKNLGYLIKIDTNGSNPQVLRRLIEEKLVNYIAMDIKGPLDKYETIAKSPIDMDYIMQSIKLIMFSGIPYEFRTTVVKSLLQSDDILKIGSMIKSSDLYILQQFNSLNKSLDMIYNSDNCYSYEELNIMGSRLRDYINRVLVR